VLPEGAAATAEDLQDREAAGNYSVFSFNRFWLTFKKLFHNQDVTKPKSSLVSLGSQWFWYREDRQQRNS
jgi:hypothetical protein